MCASTCTQSIHSPASIPCINGAGVMVVYISGIALMIMNGFYSHRMQQFIFRRIAFWILNTDWNGNACVRVPRVCVCARPRVPLIYFKKSFLFHLWLSFFFRWLPMHFTISSYFRFHFVLTAEEKKTLFRCANERNGVCTLVLCLPRNAMFTMCA